MQEGDPWGLWFGNFSEKFGEKNRQENRGKRNNLGEIG